MHTLNNSLPQSKSQHTTQHMKLDDATKVLISQNVTPDKQNIYISMPFQSPILMVMLFLYIIVASDFFHYSFEAFVKLFENILKT